MPISLPRLGPSATADGKNGPAKQIHSTRRIAWDFAVITAAAAILLVLHHQFKKPFRSIASSAIVAGSVEPLGDQPTKKPSARRRSHVRRHAAAAADPPNGSAGEAPAPTQTDPLAAVPRQSDPDQPDTKKRDDWSSPTASTPAITGNAEPPQTALADNHADQPREASKPSTVGDNSMLNLADPPASTEPSIPPTKHRRRHRSPDPAVAAGSDSSFPTLNDTPAGPSDAAPRNDSAVQPGSAAADKPPSNAGADSLPPEKAKADSTVVPGPSLGGLDDHPPSKNDSPLPSPAAASGPTEIGRRDDSTPPAIHDAPLPKAASGEVQADKPALPPANGDAFGALQDPPAEKHELHESELRGNSPGENPADSAPPKRRRRRKPPQPDSATPAPDPLHTAEQNPPSAPVVDAKPQLPVKLDEPAKTVEAPKAPLLEPKKTGDWSAPAASGEAPLLKDVAGDPKSNPTGDKPTSSAADHDPFGGLKDAPAEKQELKAPAPGVNGMGDNPPAPHKRRRKKNPADAEPATPGPVRTADQSPTSEPIADKKPEELVKPDIAAKVTEAPKSVVSDTPKIERKPSDLKPSEPKLAEPKLAEPSAVGGPSLDANASPTKTAPRPEIIAATPSPVPTASVPTATVPAGSLPVSNLASHPAADEESQPATLSFARRMPEKNDAGNSLTYKIVVRNNGSKPVKLVEVDEAVPSEQLVQATEPPAETHDQTLHWTLHDLGPHDERTIAITLAVPIPPQQAAPPQQPVPPQPIVRTAAIPKSDRSEEEHEKTAKPDEPDKLPRMELELIVPSTLRTGESCRIGFRATNLGPKSAGLKLNLDLPAQIHFQRGQQLQYKVGGLDENESREDYLTAVAAGPGTVVIHGEIVSEGRTVVAAKATCRIAGALATQQTARPNRDGSVVPASASDAASPSAAPCNCGP